MNNQRGDCGACVLVMLAMMAGAWFMVGHGGHRGMGQGHHTEAPDVSEVVGQAKVPAEEIVPGVPRNVRL